MASSKTIRLILLVVSPKIFKLHHQIVTDKFFFENVGQHRFPTKAGIDQFLYICFLVDNFIFECLSWYIKHLRCRFHSHLLTPTSFYDIRHFHVVPTFYTFCGPSTTQNSDSLENRRDEMQRPISYPDDTRTACGGAIRNTRKKKKIWHPANC